MFKFFNNLTVRIDVSADFSYVAILAPNGEIHKKSFKTEHTLSGFNHLFTIHKLQVC